MLLETTLYGAPWTGAAPIIPGHEFWEVVETGSKVRKVAVGERVVTAVPLKDVANVMLAKLASIIVVKTGFMLVSILLGALLNT